MKLKFFFIILLFATSHQACNNAEKVNTEPLSADESEVDSLGTYTTYKYDTLEGMYSGKFGDNEIRLVLTYVSDAHVTGYNLLKGLQRNISGSVAIKDNLVYFLASEPGDNKYDGSFEFTIDTTNFSLKGRWIANDEKIKSKEFKLTKFIKGNDEGKNINASNLADYFYMMADSLGYYHFESDGYVNYEYYPDNGGAKTDQIVKITGSWSLKNKDLTIFWKPNKYFGEQSKMKISEVKYDEEYSDFVLINSTGDTLFQSMY